VYVSSKSRINNVTLDNEKLEEFDLSASFLLMLCLYAVRIDKSILNNYEFKGFRNDVIEGNIYKKFRNGFNAIRNCSKEGTFEVDSKGGRGSGEISVRFITRGETKEFIQMWFNGTKDTQFVNGVAVDVGSYFKNNYTALYDLIIDIKKDGYKLYDKLVVIETNAILKIVEDCHENDIKCVTCHDAIYVKQSNKEEVEKIWNKHTDKIHSILKYEKVTGEVCQEMIDLWN